MTPEQAADKIYAATGVILGTDAARHIASYLSVMETRIAELEAALTTARREGMEEAAQWHYQQAAQAQKLADMKVSVQDAKVWSDYAENHREYAAAIRAVLEGKKDER